jgi:hypothetical protein
MLIYEKYWIKPIFYPKALISHDIYSLREHSGVDGSLQILVLNMLNCQEINAWHVTKGCDKKPKSKK